VEGVEELGSEDPGDGLDREQEVMMGRQPDLTIGSQPAARYEIVDMGVIGQVTRPGMQDAEHTDLPADKAGVTSQELSGGRRGLEEQVIEKGLMAARQWAQRSGQGEGEHEIGDGQEQILLCLQPFLGSLVLALGAVAVAAGEVAVADFAAIWASVHLSTPGFCAAALNSEHCLTVAGEQAVGVLLAVGRAVLAEDIW
jgi:hypothetical protein